MVENTLKVFVSSITGLKFARANFNKVSILATYMADFDLGKEYFIRELPSGDITATKFESLDTEKELEDTVVQESPLVVVLLASSKVVDLEEADLVTFDPGAVGPAVADPVSVDLGVVDKSSVIVGIGTAVYFVDITEVV
jgi:hypothetical protein